MLCILVLYIISIYIYVDTIQIHANIRAIWNNVSFDSQNNLQNDKVNLEKTVQPNMWEIIQHKNFTKLCNLRGQFYSPESFNRKLLKHLMNSITTLEPFAWIRWADGDMNNIKHMKNYDRFWKTLPNLYVAVGMWWMCNSFRKQWNAFADANYTYIDYFYLPMGDPCDSGMYEQIYYGVHGFLAISFQQKRHIALIGNNILKELPFIDSFFSESNEEYKILQFIKEQPHSSIILLSKGTHAKRIITIAFINNNKKHTFIDVGRALNPYVGKMEFNKPIHQCCMNAKNKSLWFAPEVC